MLAQHRELGRGEALLDLDQQFRQHGYLILVATEAELALAQKNVALQRSLGVDVTLLSAGETRPAPPHLRTDDLLAAAYSPCDGYADPYLVTTAITARARELRVIFQTECDRPSVR